MSEGIVAPIDQPAPAEENREGDRPSRERAENGRFLPGNQVARTHGLRAAWQPPDLRLTADELMAGIVSDLGGESNLTTLERSYIRKLADVEILLRLLASNLVTGGVMTASGARVRDVYGQFLSGIDRFDRLAKSIGLNRRARDVSGSLRDFVNHDQQERTRNA